jgi:aminoglycoside 6'-N-acetyltransferase I
MPTVRPVESADRPEWLRLRCALWPEGTPEEHAQEIEEFFVSPATTAVFVCPRPTGGLCGLLEAGLRAYAEGCDSSPVGFIEGWYVDPDCRREGIGRALAAAAEAWAVSVGCTEMGSDTPIDNRLSRTAHRQLGYEEVEEIVCFRKSLPGQGTTNPA